MASSPNLLHHSNTLGNNSIPVGIVGTTSKNYNDVVGVVDKEHRAAIDGKEVRKQADVGGGLI